MTFFPHRPFQTGGRKTIARQFIARVIIRPFQKVPHGTAENLRPLRAVPAFLNFILYTLAFLSAPRSLRDQQHRPFDLTPELEAWLLEGADKPVTPLTKADFTGIRERVAARRKNSGE